MSFVYTYSGRAAGPGQEVPSLQDIAVSLGRICRYAGNGVRFWPVLLHSFVVADLLPPPLKKYGLGHDGMESVFSDIPSPFKPPEIHCAEGDMLVRLYEQLDVPPPGAEEAALVKAADMEALHGEAHTVGPWALRNTLSRAPHAESLVLKYARQYRHEDYLSPDGLAVIDYVSRLQDALSN